jgi:hypothetical protein
MWIDDKVAEILLCTPGKTNRLVLLQNVHDKAKAKVDAYAAGIVRAMDEYEHSLTLLTIEERPTTMELHQAREWALCAVRALGAGAEALPTTPTQQVWLVWMNAEREIAEALESLTRLRVVIKTM